jgi:hypothetical protein
MAWTASGVFREWNIMTMQDNATSYAGLDGDTVLCALFGGNTPDKDAAVALTGYNAATSQWVTANEKTSGTDWVAGGRALTSKTFTTPASGVAMFDAADLTSAATATLSNVEGCLIYDGTISGGTVVDQGFAFLWFGGAQSVTSGTFSVIFETNGLVRFTST